MATSGSASGRIASSNVYMYIEIYEDSYSVTNNTSTVKYGAYLYRVDTSSFYWASWSKIYINDGSAISGPSSYYASQHNINDKTAIYTNSYTVNHNSDGTASDQTVKIRLTASNGTDITLSASCSLTTIPRTSSVSVSNSSVTVGNSTTINITRASNSFTHKLYWGLQNSSGSVSSWNSITTGVATSYSWTVPDAVGNVITSSTSGKISIKCETISNSTSIGSSTCSLTINIPDSWKPSNPTITISDTNGYYDTYGVYLQGLSNIKVDSSSSTSGHSETISSYTVVVNSTQYTGQSVSCGIINTSGDATISVTAKDSRGRTSSSSKTITITAYTPPALVATGYRSDSNGDIDESAGAYIYLNSTASYTDTIQDNALTVTYKTKDSSTSTWSDPVSIMTESLEYKDILSGEFSAESSWDVMVTASDKFKTTSVTFIISSAKYVIDILANGHGMAFGGVASTEDSLDINWRTDANKGMTVNGRVGWWFEDGTGEYSSGNQSGYQEVCKITFGNYGTAGYADAPVVFHVGGRGYSYLLTLYMVNAQDMSTSSISYFGKINLYSNSERTFIATTSKDTTNQTITVSIYVLKSAPYDSPCCYYIEMPKYQSDRTKSISRGNDFLTSEPSGTAASADRYFNGKMVLSTSDYANDKAWLEIQSNSKAVSVGIGSGGTNRGVHDTTTNTWLIYTEGNKAYTQFEWGGKYSDRREKNSIADIPDVDEFLKKLKPREYRYNDLPDEKRYGFVAQEVLEAAGDMDTTGLVAPVFKDEYRTVERYTLQYDDLIAFLVKGWQEHDARIAELEEEIKTLKEE